MIDCSEIYFGNSCHNRVGSIYCRHQWHQLIAHKIKYEKWTLFYVLLWSRIINLTNCRINNRNAGELQTTTVENYRRKPRWYVLMANQAKELINIWISIKKKSWKGAQSTLWVWNQLPILVQWGATLNIVNISTRLF